MNGTRQRLNCSLTTIRQRELQKLSIPPDRAKSIRNAAGNKFSRKTFLERIWRDNYLHVTSIPLLNPCDPLRLVCYPKQLECNKPVIVTIFFLALFLLLAGVDMWITFAISVARPCGRIEQEAEAFCAWDRHGAQVRREAIPRLLFTCSTIVYRQANWHV
jgi:hypothetical protein